MEKRRNSHCIDDIFYLAWTLYLFLYYVICFANSDSNFLRKTNSKVSHILSMKFYCKRDLWYAKKFTCLLLRSAKIKLRKFINTASNRIVVKELFKTDKGEFVLLRRTENYSLNVFILVISIYQVYYFYLVS